MSPRATTRRLSLLAVLLAACGLPANSSPPAQRQVALKTDRVEVTGFADVNYVPVTLPIYRTDINTGLRVQGVTSPVRHAYAIWEGWDAQQAGLLYLEIEVPPGLQGTFRSSLQLQATNPEDQPEGAPIGLEVVYTVRGPLLQVTPAVQEIVQVNGGGIPAPVSFTLTGSPEGGPWEVTPIISGESFFELSQTGGATLPAVVTLTPVKILDRAKHGGVTLRFERAGQSRRAPVDVRWTDPPVPPVSATPARVDLRVYQGQVTPVAPVTVALSSADGSAVTWDPLCSGSMTSFLYPGLLGSLCTPGATLSAPGTLEVRLARSDLPLGTTNQWVRLPGGGTLIIAVEVLPATVALEGPGSIFVNETTPTAAATLRLRSRGAETPFTFVPDGAGYSITPASGLVPAGGVVEVRLEVPPAVLEALGPGVHSLVPTFHTTEPDGAEIVAGLPLTLYDGLPQVLGIGPWSDPAGAQDTVSVVGTLMTAPFTFGGIAATALAGADPALHLVTPPSLPVGRHRVGVVTASGAFHSQVAYQVYDQPPLAAAVIPSAGRKGRLTFDGPSQALHAVNLGAQRLERFEAAAGWTGPSYAVPGLADAALLAGGRQLLVVWSGGAGIHDATTLDPTIPPLFLPAALGWRIAPDQDGDALVVPISSPPAVLQTYRFDSWVPRVTESFQSIVDGAVVATSRAGGRSIFAGSQRAPGTVYTATGSSIWPSEGRPGLAAFTPDSAALDRHGARLLLVKDGTGGAGESLLADLDQPASPGRLPPTIAAAALTQRGDQAIAFDGVLRTVRRFDLTAAPDLATGEWPELGTPGGLDPGGEPGDGVVLALTADDRTLFVGGDQRILVVPLP